MEPYYQDDHVTLYHGDCLEVDRALTKIHEKTCRAWKPDITGQELFDLKNGVRR